MSPADPAAYAPNSTFASCPAATGTPLGYSVHRAGCPHFPDGAHRCAGARATHAVHVCTCRYSWTSATHTERGE